MSETRIEGPHSAWEPSNKTINVRKTTWERLHKYFTQHDSTYDSVITEILNKLERFEGMKGEALDLFHEMQKQKGKNID